MTAKTLNIPSLTIAEARELLPQCRELLSTFGELDVGSPSSGDAGTFMKEGDAVFIRTVTCYYTGRVKATSATEVVLEDAAWIASTGRFAQALKNGELDEVEPFPAGCVVSRGAIVDWSAWGHTLPTEQK